MPLLDLPFLPISHLSHLSVAPFFHSYQFSALSVFAHLPFWRPYRFYHFPVATDFTIFGAIVGFTILLAAPIFSPVDFEILPFFYAPVGFTSLPFYQCCHFAHLSAAPFYHFGTLLVLPFYHFTDFALPFYRTYRCYLYASRIVTPPCLFNVFYHLTAPYLFYHFTILQTVPF